MRGARNGYNTSFEDLACTVRRDDAPGDDVSGDDVPGDDVPGGDVLGGGESSLGLRRFGQSESFRLFVSILQLQPNPWEVAFPREGR